MRSEEIITNLAWPPPGTYLVAVSGGVDSVALLDLMARNAAVRGYSLVVGHFDHGMRSDSAGDAEFVAALAANYRLPFETERAELARKSEAVARSARYGFLERILSKTGATAIVTAHHQDDLRETIIFNTLRGSNIFGQVGFSPDSTIKRPLVGMSKQDIKNYAKTQKLEWREDSTNNDHSYARNFIRQHFLPAVHRSDPHFAEQFDQASLEAKLAATKLTDEIQNFLDEHMKGDHNGWFLERTAVGNMTDLARGYIILAAAQRIQGNVELKSQVVHEAARFVVGAKSGQHIDLGSGLRLQVNRGKVGFTRSA